MSDAKLTVDGMRFDVEVLRLQPGDRIVLTSSAGQTLSSDTAADIKRRAGEVFGDHEIVIINGLTLAVVRDEDAA